MNRWLNMLNAGLAAAVVLPAIADTPVQPGQPQQPTFEAPVQPGQPQQPAYAAPVQPGQPQQPAYAAPVQPEPPQQPAYEAQIQPRQSQQPAFESLGERRRGYRPPPFPRQRPSRGMHIERDMNESGYELRIFTGQESPESVQVEVQGRSILITRSQSEQSQQSDDRGSYSFSRSFSDFKRRVSVPRDADAEKMQRVDGDGVITVTLPRQEGFASPGSDAGEGEAYDRGGYPGYGRGYPPSYGRSFGPGFGPGAPEGYYDESRYGYGPGYPPGYPYGYGPPPAPEEAPEFAPTSEPEQPPAPAAAPQANPQPDATHSQ